MRPFCCRGVICFSLTCFSLVLLGSWTSATSEAGTFPWLTGYGYGYGAPAYYPVSSYQAPISTSAYYGSTSAYYGPFGLWGTRVTNYAPVIGTPVTVGYAGGYAGGCNSCAPCADPCSPCSPCGSPCASGNCVGGNCSGGNCPNGNCGAGYTPPITDGPTPEPTEATPDKPQKEEPPVAEPPPTYRKEPPLDEFVPAIPKENDTAVPSTIPRSTVPESSIPSRPNPDSTIPDRSTIPPNSAPNPAPNNPDRSTIPPGNSTIPNSTIPPGNSTIPPGNSTIPRNNNPDSPAETENLFFSPNTEEKPAPVEPSQEKPGAEAGLLPGELQEQPEPLNLDSVPVASLKVQRQRILMQAGYRHTAVARIPVAPRSEVDTTAQLAHK